MPNSDVDSTGRLSIRAVGGCLLLYFNNFSSGRGSITPSADSCFQNVSRRRLPGSRICGVRLTRRQLIAVELSGCAVRSQAPRSSNSRLRCRFLQLC